MIQKIEGKRVAIWAITPGGVGLGMLMAKEVEQADLFVSEKLAPSFDLPKKTRLFKKLSTAIEEMFESYFGHIFIFSTGIAVRIIAPLLKSKLYDPAVVVVDDRGLNAISLVSGHLGGANELTKKVALLIGARPIITTATDVNNLPSIDLVAKKKGLWIENPGMIKVINMAFLKKKKVELLDPFNLVKPEIPGEFRICLEKKVTGTRPAIVCSDCLVNVPRETILLRPPTLVLGIGCNRGTSMEEINCFLDETMVQENLSQNSIFLLATTQVKADEEGILLLGKKLGLEIRFYDKPSLNSVTAIQTPSKMVEKHLGVKSVCEAAAILASANGTLIVPKRIKGNVTLAVARIGVSSL